MKKNYSLKAKLFYGACICALLFSGSVVAQTYGPNLVVNPGFEESFTSWSQSSANTAIETNLERVISETKSLRLTSANENQWGNVNQVVSVVAGGIYRFMYTGRVLDAVGKSGDTYTAPRALSGEVRSGNAAAGELLLNLTIQQGTNITVSGEFTVPEGVTQVYIRIIKSYGICYADDVTLQKKDVSTALSDIFQNNFKISNNENSLSIQSENKLSTIKIINTIGQSIYKSNSPEKNIQLNGLQKGVYIIDAITSDNKKLQYKFIKN